MIEIQHFVEDDGVSFGYMAKSYISKLKLEEQIRKHWDEDFNIENKKFTQKIIRFVPNNNNDELPSKSLIVDSTPRKGAFKATFVWEN